MKKLTKQEESKTKEKVKRKNLSSKEIKDRRRLRIDAAKANEEEMKCIK